MCVSLSSYTCAWFFGTCEWCVHNALFLHTHIWVWVRYNITQKCKEVSCNTNDRVQSYTRLKKGIPCVMNMNVYMNYHFTPMYTCVTKIHMNECVMSLIPYLSRYTCVCIYNYECVGSLIIYVHQYGQNVMINIYGYQKWNTCKWSCHTYQYMRHESTNKWMCHVTNSIFF